MEKEKTISWVTFDREVQNCNQMCGECNVRAKYGIDCDNSSYSDWVQINRLNDEYESMLYSF